VGRRVLHGHGAAEELVQDVFLLIYRRCQLFDPRRGSFRAWLIQIAYHEAYHTPIQLQANAPASLLEQWEWFTGLQRLKKPVDLPRRTSHPALSLFHVGDSEGSAVLIHLPVLGENVALRRLGKNVVYAKYDGEGHSPLYWKYANRRDLYNRVISWFDEHLKDR